MADLYIMERSDAPGMVKIGSSSNPERRRRELQESHTFTMKLLAVFPCKGYLEHKVHHRLSPSRVWTGPGREFYSLTPAEAFTTVSEIVSAGTGHAVGGLGVPLVRAPVMTPVIAPSWLEELKFDPARSHLGS